jgi:heme oxygenase
MKAKLNVECPVFATSCPFKTLTSGGELLVQELDDIVNRWGLEGAAPVQECQALPPSTDLCGEPLSKTLKSGTKTVHRAAENVRFVRDFLKGKVPKDSYIELLTSLFHVYKAMERALANLPAHLCHCDFSVLRRTETLEADLRYYTGTTPEQTLKVGEPSVAARQYIERLERLAGENPVLILAHAYTRYLGDLSGGQILARSALKTYDLPPGKGVSFYNFEEVGTSASQVKAFKREYRSSLDALQFSVSQADALVEEANVAFLMNMLLFEERDVAAGHLKGIRTLEEILELVRANTSALSFQRAYGEEHVAAPTGNRCPFLPDPAKNSDDDAVSPKVCPWPWICLHDPRSALAQHPRKSTGSLLAVFALGVSAWHFPRRTGFGVFGGFLVLAHFKTMRARVPHLFATMR